MIVRSCIHDLPGFRPQNRCRRSSKRRERERERIVVPSSLNWTNSIRARIFLERCTAGSPERERKRQREDGGNRGGSGEPIEPRRACNHADGSANISASPPRSRFIFSPPDRERERGRKVPVAIGQPRTRLLHMLSISCSNSARKPAGTRKRSPRTSTIPDFPSHSCYPAILLLPLSRHRNSGAVTLGASLRAIDEGKRETEG